MKAKTRKRAEYEHAVLTEPPQPARVASWTVHDAKGKLLASFAYCERAAADEYVREVPGTYLQLTKVPVGKSPATVGR